MSVAAHTRTTANDNDIQVTWEDQQRINQFAKLNQRLDDLLADRDRLDKEAGYLDDGIQEMELMEEEDRLPYRVGDAFLQVTVTEARQRTEASLASTRQQLDAADRDAKDIRLQMEALKKDLYAKFGSSINLERD